MQGAPIGCTALLHFPFGFGTSCTCTCSGAAAPAGWAADGGAALCFIGIRRGSGRAHVCSGRWRDPVLDFTRLYAVYPSLEVGLLVVWSQVLVSVRRRRRRFYDRCPLKFFNPPLCAPFELPPSLFALRVHQIRQSGLVSLVSMTVNLLFMLFRNRAVPRRRALPFLLGCGSASARASSLLLFLRYVRRPCCQRLSYAAHTTTTRGATVLSWLVLSSLVG